VTAWLTSSFASSFHKFLRRIGVCGTGKPDHINITGKHSQKELQCSLPQEFRTIQNRFLTEQLIYIYIYIELCGMNRSSMGSSCSMQRHYDEYNYSHRRKNVSSMGCSSVVMIHVLDIFVFHQKSHHCLFFLRKFLTDSIQEYRS
jgi:hypothetical protein